MNKLYRITTLKNAVKVTKATPEELEKGYAWSVDPNNLSFYIPGEIGLCIEELDVGKVLWIAKVNAYCYVDNQNLAKVNQ